MIEIIVITLFLLLGAFGYISEKRAFNKGICASNGLHWEHFDTDSQGGRMYRAGNCYTSVSWPGIDRYAS